jgi:AraC-like DNA-binding protein
VAARRRPTISLAAATGLIEALESAGQDPVAILRSVGLDHQRFRDHHGVIPTADFARVLEEAAVATGDEHFGLHFGEHYHPKNVGPMVYVVLNSPTFGVGFQNVARYLKVHNEAAQVSVEPGEKWTYLRHQLIDLPDQNRRQHNEYSLAVGLSTIRLMAGSEWAPVEVQFDHKAPAQTSEAIRVFGAPVSYGQTTNAFIIEQELCERSIPAADARLYPIIRQYLDGVLEEMPPEDDLLASVRRTIGESMRHGDPTLTQVARRMAIGPRTLQRRLREYGVDFKHLADDTRRRFALRYLRDPAHTLTEVAYLVGYSEVSAFNRAFKRWTGATPTDYRRRPEAPDPA